MITTAGAVEHIKSRNLVLLTSLGMNTWELTLALASRKRIGVIIIPPADPAEHLSESREIMRRFGLDPQKTGFLWFDNEKEKNKTSWPIRDRIIADFADRIFPVSIRPGGNLENLLSRYQSKIVADFALRYGVIRRPRPRYDRYPLHLDLPSDAFLIHFTRTTASPWPNETDFDYYMALLKSGETYCRSAGDTLRHIIASGKIFASGKNIRDGHRVVGFTLMSRENLTQMFRYRPRLVNPYFEPYGIGLPVSAANRAGLRPVIYGPSEFYLEMPEADKPFFQNIGTNGGQWQSEREWRHRGDFSLVDPVAGDLIILVPSEDEAERFSRETGLPSLSLFVS